MQRTTQIPTIASEGTDGLAADALRAEAWAGEPFLRDGEDAAVVLATGTSRRRGLERVLAEQPPHLASGTELRRHQVDALAGMLTQLIASNEQHANGDGGANG